MSSNENDSSSKSKKLLKPLSSSSTLNRTNSILNRSTLNEFLNPSSSNSTNNTYLEIPDAATSYYSSYQPPKTSMLYGSVSSSYSSSPVNRKLKDMYKVKSNSQSIFRNKSEIFNKSDLLSNHDDLRLKFNKQIIILAGGTLTIIVIT